VFQRVREGSVSEIHIIYLTRFRQIGFSVMSTFTSSSRTGCGYKWIESLMFLVKCQVCLIM